MIEIEKTEKNIGSGEKDAIESGTHLLPDGPDEISFELIEPPGRVLRAEREFRNIALEEASKFTKIREPFLRAIEEDNYGLLPSPIYAKGFLQQYSRFLGLDPAGVVVRYEKYRKSVMVSPPEVPKALPIKIRRRRRPFYYVFTLVAFLFCAALFYQMTFRLGRSIPSHLAQETASVLTASPVPKVSLDSAGAGAGERVLPLVDSPRTVSPFGVIEASLGTAVETDGGRLVLRGRSSRFTSSGQRPHFFTRIKTEREGKVVHVWLWEGKEFHRKIIGVRPPAWSVYTYITPSPDHSGRWRAEVRDGEDVLAALDFKIEGSNAKEGR